MGGHPLKMEVTNADIWGVPLRHPRPTDVGPGGRAIRAFPGGSVCFQQGSHQQGTSSVGHQSSHAGESDSDINRSGSHRGKGWDYSSSLAGPRGRFQVSHTPDTWTKILGVHKADIGVSSDGQVSVSVPGPIKGEDLVHVALAAGTGGVRLSDEPSPLVEAVKDKEGVGNPGKVRVFPYLQLTPPHCRSCRCRLLYGTS